MNYRIVCSICESDGDKVITDEDLLYALKMRTGKVVTNLCKTHYSTYVTMYSLGKKSCCDPYSINTKKSVNHLSEITTQLSREVTAINAELGNEMIFDNMV